VNASDQKWEEISGINHVCGSHLLNLIVGQIPRAQWTEVKVA
jgi:hypothetical protein